MTKKYNTTQLTPGQEFERHIYHRDQFAHYLRWTHILKVAKVGQTILDFGCGSGEMLEVFYRNRYRPKAYVGLDIRDKVIAKNIEKFGKLDFVEFKALDLCEPMDLGRTFEIITSFEVFEHLGKWNGQAYLDNIKKHMDKDSTLYLSTPIYNGSAAANHIIPMPMTGEDTVGEYALEELKEILGKNFEIVDAFGTFASIRDYKSELNEWQQQMFDNLSKYYDTNLLAVLMAPFFPEHSRNTMWVLKLK